MEPNDKKRNTMYQCSNHDDSLPKKKAHNSPFRCSVNAAGHAAVCLDRPDGRSALDGACPIPSTGCTRLPQGADGRTRSFGHEDLACSMWRTAELRHSNASHVS